MQCFACECLSALRPRCLRIGSAVDVLAELPHRIHSLRHEVGIGYRVPRAAAQGRSHQILAPTPSILTPSSLCEDELAIAIRSTAHRKHQHRRPLRDLSLKGHTQHRRQSARHCDLGRNALHLNRDAPSSFKRLDVLRQSRRGLRQDSQKWHKYAQVHQRRH